MTDDQSKAQAKPTYIVLRQGSRGGPFSVYNTREDANRAASVAAVKNPGVAFVVFQAVGFSRIEPDKMPVATVQEF